MWEGTEKIVAPSTDNLYSRIQDPITNQWWIRHGHLTSEGLALTDPIATEAMMQSLPKARRRYVCKQAAENCGVNKCLQGWNFRSNANCPRCPCNSETTKHVLLCQGYGANNLWSTSLTNFDTMLSKQGTDPELREALVHCISQWQTQQPINLYDFSLPI